MLAVIIDKWKKQFTCQNVVHSCTNRKRNFSFLMCHIYMYRLVTTRQRCRSCWICCPLCAHRRDWCVRVQLTLARKLHRFNFQFDINAKFMPMIAAKKITFINIVLSHLGLYCGAIQMNWPTVESGPSKLQTKEKLFNQKFRGRRNKHKHFPRIDFTSSLNSFHKFN